MDLFVEALIIAFRLIQAQKRVDAPGTQQAGRICSIEQGRRSAWLQRRTDQSYDFFEGMLVNLTCN